MSVRAATLRPSVLSIAGSDSGAGAGVQADLRVFNAFGLHGLSALTAVTAQNTHRVVSVQRVPARCVRDQLAALFADFDIRAVKIGMLGSAANVRAVAAALRQWNSAPVVLDPVLVSSSGTPLLTAAGIDALRRLLIPLAQVLTPNLPEAAHLLGRRVTARGARAAARDLRGLGCDAVLLKGGHARGEQLRDVLHDVHGFAEYHHPRLSVQAHGTGCVLSAAIAAGLAQGWSRRDAVKRAQTHLQRALRASYAAGAGPQRVLPALQVEP